jgi:anti-sigma-K factor RskA
MSADVHTLVGAYVVDAVTADERAEFEAHLESCDECREEVTSLREVAVTLAAANEVAPPVSLRESVLAAVAVTPQVSPTVPDSNVVPLTPGAAPRKRRVWPLAAAAASVLVLAAAGLGISMGYQSRQESLAMERDVMMVTSAPDAHSVELDLGNSHVVMSEKMDGVAVMGQEAPMPEDGMEYQVWLIMDDGGMAPGPTFMPSSSGEFMTVMHTPLAGVTGFCVTQEPAGGSQTPTGDVAAVVHL